MDDSLLHMVAGAPQMLRRARGFVPRPLPLPWKGPPLLALGGHLKASFCLLHNNLAYVSQHLGDLDSPASRAAFSQNIGHLSSLLRLKPALLAADLHPEYYSTQWAEATGLPCLHVQHHVAHVAAVWAEYPEVEGPLLGLALDGTGLGEDGLPWGGELLLLHEKGKRWERLGHLKPLALPGGDVAAKHPWRMAVSALLALGEEKKALQKGAPHGLTPALLSAWKRGALPAPPSSSLGRYLDAAASLLGVCEVASYEAEGPMRLEALATSALHAPPWPLEGFEVETGNILNLWGLLQGLGEGGAEALPERALWLHLAVAKALAEWASLSARPRGLSYVALSGGCIQNRLLCEALSLHLRRLGLRPLLPQCLPPNDGALCLGQALVAAQHFL
jgi:hydrogenase maturation protein HypF